MSEVLACRACGAAWHTDGGGITEEESSCLRCGGALTLAEPSRGTDEHPAAAVVLRYCRAWAAGRLDEMLGLAHPEVEFSALGELTPGRSPTFRGHDGLVELQELHVRLWDREFRSELLGIEVLDPERVLVHASVSARSSDGNLDPVSGHAQSVWRVQDGAVTSVRARLARDEAMAGSSAQRG